MWEYSQEWHICAQRAALNGVHSNTSISAYGELKNGNIGPLSIFNSMHTTTANITNSNGKFQTYLILYMNVHVLWEVLHRKDMKFKSKKKNFISLSCFIS